MYCETLTQYGMIEVLIATGIFFLIPKSLYKHIFLEQNEDIKVNKYNENCLDKITNDFTIKVRNLTDILGMIGNILNYKRDEEFSLENKYNVLIDDISEKTCVNCERKLVCWKNELTSTYNSFVELIDNCQNDMFPLELEKKCLKKYTLIKNLENTMSIYRINENLKKRLKEGRELLSKNINNMALTINELVDNFQGELDILTGVENDVKVA